MTYRDWILVGVDGSRGSAAAVRYAAREAVRRDLGLRLVHVAPARVELAPIYPGFELSRDGVAAVAREVLAQSRRIALGRVSLGRLSTAVLDGERAEALRAEAGRAALVVLGDQRRLRHEPTVTSWTCDEVLARTTSPVILVPADWSLSHERGDVVAGLRTPDGPRHLIRTAVEEAHRRGARLRLVHACEPAPLASEGGSSERDPEQLRRQIQDTARAVAAEFPRVTVDVQVEAGCPREVLRAASEDAALLILEHPAGDEQTARAAVRSLLRGRRCPVEFLPAVSSVGSARVAGSTPALGDAAGDVEDRRPVLARRLAGAVAD